ncbi:MAG: glycosyltransferase family 4 protein [Solirubrobacteraceae bacterium]
MRPGLREATVVHLLPLDVLRGAQLYAHALRDALRAGGGRHHIVTLFASSGPGPGCDLSLAVPAGRLRRAGFDPRAAIRLRGVLRELGADVVVAHGGEPLKYAAFARPRDTRLIYLKIGLTGGALRTGLQLRLLRAAAQRTDAIAAVSDEMAEEARLLLGRAATRIVVIPNGRDADTFRPRATRPAGHRPRLAFVGQLEPDKRPELFCDVVRALRERGAAPDAVLVGDGALLGALRSVAGSAGVDLLGARVDVPDILAGCDVLVFCGAGREGMPGVLIEAGLCGLPAVTTAVPGAADVVEDGVTGFVVGVDDEDALIDRSGRLAVDAALRERMGSAARDRCVERFSIQASARRWQALLDCALREPGDTAPGSARHSSGE